MTAQSRRTHQVVHEIREIHPLQRLFLWDVLRDPRARPPLVWAAATLLLGTLVYHWIEGWGYLDALYFCVISLATVGYGDLTPTTPLGKLFTIVYVINGIVILLGLFDQIRVVRAQSRQAHTNAPAQEEPI
jgi:hypothetical protein